jgi:hypothetical protein
VFAVQSFCKERDYKHINRLSRQFRKWAKRMYFVFKKGRPQYKAGMAEASGGRWGGGGSMIINVPVVYMMRAVMILMRAIQLQGPLEGMGLENRDFVGP